MVRRSWLLVLLLFVIAGGVRLGYGVRDARRAALASCAKCPFGAIAVALHSYHDVHGCFPPAYIADADGRPMHSWRVLLLPYVDSMELYRRYDFHEPWDGPHNRQLFDAMPKVFHSETEPPSTRFANLVVVTGPGTAFPGAEPTRIADFQDGLDRTILATEVANSDIVWTEPRDLDIRTMALSPNAPGRPSISAVSWRDPYVVLGDSIRTYPVKPSLTGDALRAMLTIAGGEGTPPPDGTSLPDRLD